MVMSRSVRHIVVLSLVAWSMTTSARNDEAEWFETDDPTTKVYYGTRRTTIGEAEFIPRTSKRTTPSPSNAGVGTSTLRPAVLVPTNLTDAITTLLKNFSKLMTADEYSSTRDCGTECLTNVVRLEMFTIAAGGGNHFVLPPNTDEKIEQKQRKRASALGALWLDLFCSEDIGAILSNVTRETVARQYPTALLLTQSKMYEILANVFDKLDDAIEEDTFLATMYNAEQIRSTIRVFDTSSANKKVYFSFDELKKGSVSEETLLEWSNNVDIRKFLIHKQFLGTKYSDGEDAVAVRSILKVARERCCMDRMQKIYTSALDECARNFVVADYPLNVMKTFIDKLTKAVKADEKVNEEWVKIKNKMVDETRIKKSKGRRVSDI